MVLSHWELNVGPLQIQKAFLITEPSLPRLFPSLLFPSSLIKQVFGDLARPSRSPLDIQELDVTNNIKVKAVHEFKRNVL